MNPPPGQLHRALEICRQERSAALAQLLQVRLETEALQTKLKDLAHTVSEQKASYSSQIEDRDTKISALTDALGQRDSMLDAVSNDMAKRESRLEELTADIAQQNGRIACLSADLTEREARIAQLIAQANANAAQIESLNSEIEQREHRISNLYASHSWRITAPFRYLVTRRSNIVRTLKTWIRALYLAFPLPFSVKLRLKGLIFSVLSPLIQNTDYYREWITFEATRTATPKGYDKWGPIISEWTRVLYLITPLPMSLKIRIKGVIFAVFSPLLQNRKSYQAWRAFEQAKTLAVVPSISSPPTTTTICHQARTINNDPPGPIDHLQELQPAGSVVENPAASGYSTIHVEPAHLTQPSVADSQPKQVQTAPRFNLLDTPRACILTTAHCLYVARLIHAALARAGIASDIIFRKPEAGYDDVPHFVICPHMFPDLPSLYVAFQMEQSVSSRWFDKNYFQILENSYAIFDYSTVNIGYLTANGLHFNQIYFLPISYLQPCGLTTEHIDKEHDVLFYGDINCERRQKFICEIRKHHQVKVISDLFGDALATEIKKARIVVNIHYYENALLETTRLYECLSLDSLVISEKSSDFDQHSELRTLVDFTEIDDIDGMIRRIKYWLSDESRLSRRISANRAALRSQKNDFEYHFFRFLLASENIDFNRFYDLAARHVDFKGTFVCLGLPEATERREEFQKDNRYGIEYFHGLRHSKPWIGCGLSYKFIMLRARDLGLDKIIVCEDDVEFLCGWDSRFETVRAYLEEHRGRWDLFSGLIADLHDNANIEKVDTWQGIDFIYLDRMVSTVFNIYSRDFFSRILQWNSGNLDETCNTIDRFLEQGSGLRVVTTIPFLVGHKEDLHSTIWGFHNQRYREMIDRSTLLLQSKVDEYRMIRKDKARIPEMTQIANAVLV